MSELKATPGPWHVPHIAKDGVRCNCRSVLSEHRFGGICEIHVDNGKRIGDGGNDAPPLVEAKANAHLIAAAPELYDCLDSFPGFNSTPEEFVPWTKRVVEVLAKAKGE